ncbi:hypothetical protein D3C77_785160 [compost metagenome]
MHDTEREDSGTGAHLRWNGGADTKEGLGAILESPRPRVDTGPFRQLVVIAEQPADRVVRPAVERPVKQRAADHVRTGLP